MSDISNRRKFLASTVAAGGLGIAGSAWWLANQHSSRSLPLAQNRETAKEPHFASTAKNVICLFMAGAPSQIDLFDYKPVLDKQAGRKLSLEGQSSVSTLEPTSYVWPSPYQFTQHGESGTFVSELLPHTAGVVDEVCLIRSMVTNTSNHHPGQHMFMTGVTRFGHPTLGAWVSYGLGTENEEMPGYMVLSSGEGTAAGASNWSSGFLPSAHQGVPLRGEGDPILYLKPQRGISSELQADSIELIKELDSLTYEQTRDPEVLNSIDAYQQAFRMQVSAPGLFDISKESKDTLRMYGLDRRPKGFGLNCLLARRLVESGVRFIQLNHSSWDAHTRICENHEQHCNAIDQGTAALIQDLRQRGLLEETIVLWGGEFGRTPTAEHRRKEDNANIGRDHQASGFTVWAAGGGFQAGMTYGSTDELGLDVAENPVHVHDLQATILHCLGLNHKRLTYPHRGRDQRLTDTGGNVVSALLSQSQA